MDSILIHTCCADCFLNSINYLKEENIIDDETKIISLFYNPNIHPRSEYMERLNAFKKVIPSNVKLVIPDYRPAEYLDYIQGKKDRCSGCWELRTKYLFDYASKNSIKNITTTLLVSKYQNSDAIREIMKEYNKKYNLNIIDVSAKHNLKNFGFYKQNYCGCCFSLIEKFENKNQELQEQLQK